MRLSINPIAADHFQLTRRFQFLFPNNISSRHKPVTLSARSDQKFFHFNLGYHRQPGDFSQKDVRSPSLKLSQYCKAFKRWQLQLTCCLQAILINDGRGDSAAPCKELPESSSYDQLQSQNCLLLDELQAPVTHVITHSPIIVVQYAIRLIGVVDLWADQNIGTK